MRIFFVLSLLMFSLSTTAMLTDEHDNNHSFPMLTDETTCGATITKEQCENDATKSGRTFFAEIRPNTEITSWYTENEHFKHYVVYAVWNNTSWSKIYVENVDISQVIAHGCTLNNVFISGTLESIDWDSSNITNTTFKGTFRDVDFKYARLTNVSFIKAKFEKKYFVKRSNFDHATLDNVQFKNSSLKGVSFKGAQLKDVSFDCSHIENANYFTGAKVWNHNINSYVLLTDEQIRELDKAINKCKKDEIFNLSTWLGQCKK